MVMYQNKGVCIITRKHRSINIAQACRDIEGPKSDGDETGKGREEPQGLLQVHWKPKGYNGQLTDIGFEEG